MSSSICRSQARAASAALFWLAVSTPAGAQGSEQTIARLSITPALRTVAVGDSLRLEVRALDARGTAISDVTIRFTAEGGRFQGNITQAGVVRGGAPGTVPVAITATRAGGRPHVERIEVRILPGPATRMTLSPTATSSSSASACRSTPSY